MKKKNYISPISKSINTFLKIKNNERLEIVYDKKSKNFLSLIYLSLIKLII